MAHSLPRTALTMSSSNTTVQTSIDQAPPTTFGFWRHRDPLNENKWCVKMSVISNELTDHKTHQGLLEEGREAKEKFESLWKSDPNGAAKFNAKFPFLNAASEINEWLKTVTKQLGLRSSILLYDKERTKAFTQKRYTRFSFDVPNLSRTTAGTRGTVVVVSAHRTQPDWGSKGISNKWHIDVSLWTEKHNPSSLRVARKWAADLRKRIDTFWSSHLDGRSKFHTRRNADSGLVEDALTNVVEAYGSNPPIMTLVLGEGGLENLRSLAFKPIHG